MHTSFQEHYLLRHLMPGAKPWDGSGTEPTGFSIVTRCLFNLPIAIINYRLLQSRAQYFLDEGEISYER